MRMRMADQAVCANVCVNNAIDQNDHCFKWLWLIHCMGDEYVKICIIVNMI